MKLDVIVITVIGYVFKAADYVAEREQVQGKQYWAKDRTLGNSTNQGGLEEVWPLMVTEKGLLFSG